MCKELIEKRRFRPNHRDVECFLEDDFGVVRPVYVKLPADIDKTVAAIVAEHDSHCAAVTKCLKKHKMHEHIERAKQEVQDVKAAKERSERRRTPPR